MTEQEIERCLERFTIGKATDVMNFDYAGTLAYIQRLKAENAALCERLEKAVELPCKIGDIMYQVFSKTQDNPIPFSVEKMRVIIQSDGMKIYVEEICGTGGIIGSTAFNRKSAEARLAELKGEKKNG